MIAFVSWSKRGREMRLVGGGNAAKSSDIRRKIF
jgi:hypothetical protein